MEEAGLLSNFNKEVLDLHYLLNIFIEILVLVQFCEEPTYLESSVI